MKVSSLTPQIRQVWGRIDALDLDPIKVKLMDQKEGKGWTREFADRIEVQYRQFLKLASLQQGVVVPSTYIDDFWHNHILDTHKYAEDCNIIFGYFLHHFPYLGMRGVEDRKNLMASFAWTQDLVKEMFGEHADWTLGRHAADATSICKSCGTSDCAPDPSCGNDPSPSYRGGLINSGHRPRLD